MAQEAYGLLQHSRVSAWCLTMHRSCCFQNRRSTISLYFGHQRKWCLSGQWKTEVIYNEALESLNQNKNNIKQKTVYSMEAAKSQVLT
jgi:hypothetical protein